MSNLSIKIKIWLSFGILLALLVTVGIITVSNLRQNEKKLVELVSDVQPAVVMSLNLIDQLDRAAASLGFYLLSKEEAHKKEYLTMLKKISESSSQLQSLKIIKNHPRSAKLAKIVKIKTDKIITYQSHMLELAVNDALNVPAMKFASTEVNPRVQIMMQYLQEMLMSEEEEEASEQRKQLLIDIGEIRHILAAAVSELRVYLAFRNDMQIRNFVSFRDTLKEKVELFKTRYDENFLTFVQVEAMASFYQTFEEYFKAADRLFEIHHAEDWRQDAYIIRTELSPLLSEIQGLLTKTVNEQQNRNRIDSANLTLQAYRTQLVVAGLMGTGFVVAMLIGFLLSRAINKPIAALKKSARELAMGNLDEPIDISRKDELGNLALSFTEMRDSIRKKINDLGILNTTGEALASMRTQIDALEKSLQVMGEQTNVEWGSVYLFNEETQRLEIKAFYPDRNKKQKQEAKSFALNEGIAGTAAAKHEVIYIPDSSHEPDFVIQEEQDEKPRAMICVPLLDGNKIFGVMNFCGEIDKVHFDESDAKFAETIARMTVITSKNIEMLQIIEEQNRTLEQKVLERTIELQQKTKDIDNMLQNMHQGIFTIFGDNKVHHEYSAYLESILEQNEIAGIDVMDLLFTNTNLGVNAIDQISTALGALVGEDSIMFDFNKHLLVTEYNKKMPDGKIKILELGWDPIVDPDQDIIEKLMVTVRDVTEIRELQAEAEQQKGELEIIGQILAISSNKFTSFIQCTNQFIDENEKLIKNTHCAEPDVIAILFRNMHTIKGNARTYGFHSITNIVHQAENTYDKLRKNKNNQWDTSLLLDELFNVKKLIGIYHDIYNNKLAITSPDGVLLDSKLFEKAKQTLDNSEIDNPDNLIQTVKTLQNLIQAIGTESVNSMLDNIVTSIPRLAEQLGKEVPDVIINDHGVRLTSDVTTVLKNVFTHEIHNSVDHGIESKEERQALGKSKNGTITLEVDHVEDKLVFRLFDDGRGLALARLKQKAIDSGILKSEQIVTDEQLAELIFDSGVSTTNDVSDISGRGVGMDAVRQFVENLGGNIEICFTGEADENHSFRPFESRITLPLEYSVKVA